MSLSTLLLAVATQAAPIASESFEYDTTAGGTLLSNTVYRGGTGWSTTGSYTNWVATYASGLRLDSATGGAGSSLGGTNSVGNRAYSFQNAINARSLASGFKLDSDYYTAFLARTDSATDAFRVEFSYQTPTKNIRWKPFELNSDGTIETTAGITEAVSAAPVWSNGVTYLVVSKWEATGDHSYTKIFDVEAGTSYLTEVDWENEADVHAAGLSGATILDVYLTASSVGVEIDEFKIGTTYADVVRDYTAVGEPPPPTPEGVVFAYENFYYAPGSVLAGGLLDGGSGWSGGWTNGGVSGLTLRSTDDSLWGGNSQAYVADGSTMIDSSGGNTGSRRDLSTAIDLGSTNLYFAALVQSSGAPKARFVFYDGGSVKAVFGFFDADGEGDSPDLFVHPSSESYPTNFISEDALTPGVTKMLVMKRTAAGLSASLLPADGSVPTEPASWDLTAAGATGASVDELRIVVNEGILRIDEIGVGSTFEAAITNLTTEVPSTPMQETVGFAADQPLTTKDRSWTYTVKEAGDYQLGLAWVEVESGDNVAVEIFTNGTNRVKALYAPAGEVTRIETRLENLAANDTITVKVTSNGGRYRAGYQIASSTPTFGGQPLFDVATYGAVGDGVTDDFAAIQAAVTAAKNAGGGIIQFNGAKTYRSIGLDDGTVETLIDLEEANNIKVEGNGALVVLHPPDRFTNIRYAENIQVEGFTIDYDPIPYYQGTITDINVANMTIDIDVPERYPEPEVGEITDPANTVVGRGPFFGRSFIPDAPGARSGRGNNIYVASTAQIDGDPRKIRIQVPQAGWNGADMLPRVLEAYNNNATEFVVPDYNYGHRNGSSLVYGSSRVKLSNLQYHNMGLFWLTITQNDGPITLSNVDLEVTDPATELLASWRDGMHIKNGRWGILIEEGDWDGAAMYDDTFAIYSRRQVVDSVSNTVAVLKPAVFNRESWLWQPGDWASFWSPDQETLRGMARVVSKRDLESVNYEITFESIPAGVSANDVVLHEESLNRGTLIRNNRTTSVGTEDASTRLRGTDMRFENNHFEDFGFRLEWEDSLGTPRARDVVVEDTTISGPHSSLTFARPLGVLFKNCVLDGLEAKIHLGADDIYFENVAWSNMTGNIMEVTSDSHVWLFGGSSRTGSTSGLSGHVSKDASSTVTYSAPADVPPAEPPSGGDITPPDAPVLAATVAGGTVLLDWPDDGEAVHYTVYRRTSVDGLYTYLAKTTLSGDIDVAAVIGRANEYVVTATDANGNESEYSNEASAVPSGTVLTPVADAYVMSGTSSNSNYGSDPQLNCKTDPVGNYTRESYLRFDLSALSGTIAQAVLRLKVESVTAFGDTHTAHFVADDSWGESTIKWSNKPAASAALDGAVFPEVGSWLELDLADQAATELAGDQLLSTVLISAGSELVSYASKEADLGSRPELAVATMTGLPPAAPTGLAVSESAGDAVLDWVDQSVLYGIYRGTVPGGPYTHVMNTATNRFVDDDNAAATLYYYVVTAINAEGYASGFSDEASTLSITPPVITAVDPSIAATFVSPSADLTATFSELITVGSGNITITNLSDSTATVIAVSDSSQVSISGSMLTIDPSANLDADKAYAVLIEPGVIEDQFGNLFAGITTAATWHFTTAGPFSTRVLNGDFSENATAFSTFPGYIGGANPSAISRWSFSNSGSGSGGINGVGLSTPFGPGNQSAATYYGFLQNGGTQLAQDLSGRLDPNSTYRISFIAASRDGNSTALGSVTVGDSSATFYHSGTQQWSTAAFEPVSAEFTTGASFDGPVVITLRNDSPTGDLSVDYSNIEIVKVSGYDIWAQDYQLIYGSLGHDDTDGMNNLVEYALGGNPTNNDAAAVLPVFQTRVAPELGEGGLENNFYYIHNERTDDPSLVYTVEVSTNLVSNGWKQAEPAPSIFSNGWKIVTHEFPTFGTPQQFIRLRIEEE